MSMHELARRVFRGYPPEGVTLHECEKYVPNRCHPEYPLRGDFFRHLKQSDSYTGRCYFGCEIPIGAVCYVSGTQILCDTHAHTGPRLMNLKLAQAFAECLEREGK
jgi:hypothetical protein